jgi:hypothetical protein
MIALTETEHTAARAANDSNNRIETRELQPGPMMLKARKLYWDWAHSEG